MTQQQFAPQQVPQYPQAPQQGYPAQPAQYPQQPYPQQVQQPYPQQQFPQGYGQPQAPQQPLVQGNLDDFYNQPTSGGGPGISWSDKAGNKKPVGTTYVGVVARDVTHGDVQQQTNPQGMPQFFRDGRPKFQMKVPLRSVLVGMPDQTGQVQLQPSPEFPDGEAAWYVRGQARDELTRAMSAAGCSGSPREGATVQVTLVNRRPSSAGFQPANVVQIVYTPGPNDRPGQAPAEQAQAPAPSTDVVASAPVAAQPVQPVPGQVPQAQAPTPAAPSYPAQVDPAAQSFAQQQVQAYTQGNGYAQQPGQQQAPPEWAQPQPQQQQMPPQQVPQQPQGQAPLQPPADLNDEQKQLLARLTGQGQ